ncbi:phage tail fiber protein [Serratia fonticola]|uniref:phage tail fiber protein n=1 Tax=Serratia fonticola TaxID=47917 RepID=UPI000E0EAAA9|nr:prophage tail fiber N-terminal domain-containing protein [Serratia fonticola]RDL25126.1 tail fiber-like protein [Serratia fonticola]
MAVISGVLKGPMGDALEGVVIELRALRTSATVITQERSSSVTNATGRYSLTVEPGDYSVFISAFGRTPENRGSISVKLNSATGTLNDFLLIPGESDLNPEIVATVDRMRADAAASAATAKTNADIAVAAVNDTLNKTILTPQNVAGLVSFKGGLISYGDQILQATNATAVLLRIRDMAGLEKSAIYCQTDTGVINYRWGGQAYTMQGRADGFMTVPKGHIFSTALATPAAVVEAVTASGGINNAPFNFRGADASSFDNPNNYSIGTWNGFSVVPTMATGLGSGVEQGKPVFFVNARAGTAHALNNIYVGSTAVLKVGDSGLGSSTPVTYSDANTLGVNQFIKLAPGTPNMPTPTTAAWAGITWGYDGGSRCQILSQQGQNLNNLVFRVSAPGGVWSNFATLWHSTNTTVDANGFIKKASPIVKLFTDGSSELNEQSQGVTTERVSEGVYRISGTLGFNADAEWGGVDGGIEIPTDRNKLPLVWVDYEVDETGDLLIKTFHRVNSTAPKFAQNVKTGYKEGQPIDIPAGRWIDLRVEMPGGDEPEYEPVLEDEVPEVTPEVAEPGNGEEPKGVIAAPGEIPASSF